MAKIDEMSIKKRFIHNYGKRKTVLDKGPGVDEADYNFGHTMGVNDNKISRAAGTGRKGQYTRANQIQKTKGDIDARGYAYGRTKQGEEDSDMARAYNTAKNNTNVKAKKAVAQRQSTQKKKTKKKKC